MVQKYPFRILFIFLVFTEVLFFIGPNKYYISNNWGLAIYLIIVNLALYFGYSLGVKKFVPSEHKINDTTIHVFLIIGFVSIIRTTINTWANHGLSFSIDTIVNGILNPGEAYSAKGDVYYGSFIDMTLLYPFKFTIIPLGLYFWKRLPKLYKGIVIIGVFLQIVQGLGVGVRKQVLDVLLIFFFSYIAIKPNIIENPQKRRWIRLASIGFIIVFLIYFTFSIASRYGYGWNEMLSLSGTAPRGVYIKYLPPWLVYALQVITSYLCQGYYALAEGLEMGIKEIAMFGDSWVSIYYSKKFFGYDPTPMTYMASLEAIGIDMRVNWHTMYLWLANQYTFIGVPIVIFIIGYFFAQVWNDAVYGKNGYSMIMISFFIVMVFYMFANNQVFSDSAISFWLWFIVYQMSRKKLI